MSRVRHTAYLSAARFVGMAVSFLSVPFFIRWLGGEQAGLASWGAFVFVQAMGRYAAMIDSGFAVAANRLMTRAHAGGDAAAVWRIWKTGLRASIGIGLAGGAITLLFGLVMPVSGLKPGELPIQLFAAAGVGFLAETWANGARTALTSRQQFAPLAVLQGLAQLAGALAALGAVYATRHPAALFAGPIGTSATLAAGAFLLVRKEAVGAADRGVFAELWGFVRQAYPNHVLSIVAGSTDRVLLEKSLGSAPLGGYAIASRIPEVISLLLQPIQDTAQPLLSRAHVEGEPRFSDETLRIVRMALAIGMAFILVPCAFAEPLLKLWLRDQYVPGLGPILIGIAGFRAIEHLNVTILLAFIAAGKPGLANPTSLFNALTTAALTFPAAYNFGLEGVVVMKLLIQLQALLLLAMLFRRVVAGRRAGPTLRAMGLTVVIGAGVTWLGWKVAAMEFIIHQPAIALVLAPLAAGATFVGMAALKLTPVPGALSRWLPFLAPRASEDRS